MAHRAEPERKPKHLGLAAGEIALRIDAGDSERRRRRRELYSLGRQAKGPSLSRRTGNRGSPRSR